METGAIYVRVSTPGQVATGTAGGQEMQLEQCLKIAADQGIDVPEEYQIIEQGSGAFIERRGLDELRTLAANKVITKIITFDLDRIMRDNVWLCVILREFEEHGIELFTTKGLIGYSMTDELVNTIMGWASRLEKEKIRMRTMAGKITTAKLQKVLPTGGRIYGYDYYPRDKVNNIPQRREINEREAHVVKQMFKMALSGHGANTIARKLNEAGIVGKKGCNWHAWTVKNTLKNPAYMGLTLYGKETSRLGKFGKRKRQLADPADVLHIEGFTPPIVSKASWNRVQSHLNRAGRRSGKAKMPYMLSGLIKCEHCGGTIGGSMQGKNTKYRYYACRNTSSSRFGKPTCTARRSQVAVIDERVIDVFQKLATDKEFLVSVLRNENEAVSAPDDARLRSELEKRIAELEKEQNKYLEALVAAPTAKKTITAKLEETARQLDLASRQLNSINTVKGSDTKEITLDEFQLRLKKGIAAYVSVEDWKQFLTMVGFSGTINSEGDLNCQISDDLGVNQTDSLLTIARTWAKPMDDAENVTSAPAEMVELEFLLCK